MNTIGNFSLEGNETLTLLLLSLAVFRIYLEVVGFNFAKLPLTAKMPEGSRVKFHKMGFYFSLGYFVLFAPSYLLS